MLGSVDEIDYDGDRVRKVMLRFPAIRAGDTEVVREVRACERIGQGSFGTVYRAVCDGYPRLALKISTGKSTRLRQELDVLSRVCTKGHLLLPRFEFGALNKAADLIVIGMELCVPSTLHDLLLSTRITSEAEMLFMAYQVVQAVSYVHEEGCIHRDIKLQNFVFDLDGNLKLIDFGLACNSLSPPAGDVVAGTVSFMSPEMAHNALHKDKRVSVGVAADVWSLGIVLFSIFTQRNPYPATEATTVRGRSGSRSTGSNGDGKGGDALHTAAPPASSSHKDRERPEEEAMQTAANAGNDANAQQRLNERLLRRVAAGAWQWPVGVGVSEDLKQLVNSILITDPEKRPTVRQILQHKLWNLRRRYPPAAVAAFLGVQDDFLLSHDEAHLMRAVEERSAGVTASLLHSRTHSPNSSRPRNAEHSAADDHTSVDDARDEQQLSHHDDHPGTSTPPPSARGSLKVVQRGGEGGVDGAVAVQVYDVRASTRKRSKPIREISVVMAEETAKRRTARSGKQPPQQRGRPTTASSAPPSRRPSRATSATAVGGRRKGGEAGEAEEDDVHAEVMEEPRRASSAGASLRQPSPPSHAAQAGPMRGRLLDDEDDDGDRAGVEEENKERHEEGEKEMGREDEDEDVVEVSRPLMQSASSKSTSRPRSVPRRTTAAAATTQTNITKSKEGAKGQEDDAEREEAQLLGLHSKGKSQMPNSANATGPSTASSAPLLSMTSTASTTYSAIIGAHPNRERARSSSEELLGNSDSEASPPATGSRRPAASRSTSTQGKVSSKARATSSKRPRDPSLRQPSSSILQGVKRHFSKSLPATADGGPSASPPHDETVQRGETTPAATTGGAAARRTLPHPPPTRTQRLALELSLSVIWQDEADHRRFLSSALLIEHEWLLASFRLTIEEDQERYNITWLAEEQEKSAAHPHRFKEMTRVTSKKYQLGFVCDLCDYEFLPGGKDEKDLHYFHCPCGRDLCPDCFEEYQRQCTCSCCRAVHPNSCVLREHLMQTGGTQLYGGLKGVERGTAAVTADVRGSFESSASSSAGRKSGGVASQESATAAAPPRRRPGRPRKSSSSATDTPSTSAPSSQRGVRAGKDTARRRRGGGGGGMEAVDVDDVEAAADEVAQIHLPRMSVAAMQQERTTTTTTDGAARRRGRPRANGDVESTSASAVASPLSQQQEQRPEEVEVRQRKVSHIPEGPWRPFARFKKDRQDEAARQPTPEERDALLNGDWIRHFYLFPNTPPDDRRGRAAEEAEDPYAFVYHAQPGRTGAVFLTSDFPMHSAVFSMLERQFFVVDQVDTVDGADTTRATSLLRAKGQPDLKIAFQALQDIVAYDTNMLKQQRTPGTVSVYQAPRSAYSCNGEAFLYVRWFRFNEDRTLSAFLLSNGAVQVFVNNEYELRWFDETRKFLIRYNGVCELVEDSTFTLAPAINHLLYDSFDA